MFVFFFFLYLLVVNFFFVFLLFFLNFLFSIKFIYLNKLSFFECGFDKVKSSDISFSIHFFFILLLFIIFDLELVLIIGFLLSDFSSSLSFFFIYLFIILGLYVEWFLGKLVWFF